VRPYRPLPTILVVVAFLVAGNALVAWMQPDKAQPATPEEEMWLVYFALAHAGDPPDALDRETLRAALGRLDPAVEEVADRVSVLSYSTNQYGFVLEARHQGDPRPYRITSYGLE